jgi:4-diphosphocytidyl-2-C-methyl-D-erythritol kinase
MHLSNDLQQAALRLRPELGRALEQGRLESAHGAILSGSGPSCLFLCEGRAHALQVAGGLRSLDLGHVSFAPGPVPGARLVAKEI